MTAAQEGDSRDEFAQNNTRTVHSDAWLLLMYVHREVYDKGNSVKSLYGNYSFEDFIQHHIDVMNQKFADSKYPSTPDGCLARVAIDRFFVYDDTKDLDELLKAADGPVVRHLYDGIWGFPWKKAASGEEQHHLRVGPVGLYESAHGLTEAAAHHRADQEDRPVPGRILVSQLTRLDDAEVPVPGSQLLGRGGDDLLLEVAALSGDQHSPLGSGLPPLSRCHTRPAAHEQSRGKGHGCHNTPDSRHTLPS